MTEQLTEQERFFFDHAGYSYDPKTETVEQGRERCARELAAAERRLNDSADFYVNVSPEDDPMDEKDGPQWVVTLYRRHDFPQPDEVVGSLGCIDTETDADPYLRVVAAELADEHLCAADDDGQPDIRNAAAWLTDACEQLASLAHEHNDSRLMDLRATLSDIVSRATITPK